MKKLFAVSILAMLILSLAVDAGAQTTHRTKTLKSARTYAVNQIDTLPSATGTINYLGAYTRVETMIHARDTVYCVTAVDARPIGASTWTQVAVDSVTFAAGSGAGSRTSEGIWDPWALRNGTAEVLTGVGYEYRFRVKFMDYGQGVTSPTYDFMLNYGR